MLNVKTIKLRRSTLGLTLAQAASAAGMKHRQVWHRIESGARKSVSLPTIIAMAQVLKCGAGDLLETRTKLVEAHCGKASKPKKSPRK